MYGCRLSDIIVDDESLNHDYCDACGLAGDFICCETCPRSFHYAWYVVAINICVEG